MAATLIGAGLFVAMIRGPAPQQILIAVTLLIGAAFLLQQLRFHYFGSLIFILPPVQWIAHQVRHTQGRRKMLGIGAGICFVAIQMPALNSLGSFPELAGDRNYAINRMLLNALANRCAIDPGIVLARFGDGHYLRYHTSCAVIANPMTITPQHFERIALTETMFATAAVELRETYPWVDYLYLWRADNPLDDNSKITAADNPKLIQELLITTPLPIGFEVLGETAFELPDGRRIVFGRALRVIH